MCAAGREVNQSLPTGWKINYLRRHFSFFDHLLRLAPRQTRKSDRVKPLKGFDVIGEDALFLIASLNALDLVLNRETFGHIIHQHKVGALLPFFKPPVPLPPQTSRVCSRAHTWALLRHGSEQGHLLLLSVQHLTGRSLPLHMDYRVRLPPLPSPQSHSLLTFGAADHMVRRITQIGGIFFFSSHGLTHSYL